MRMKRKKKSSVVYDIIIYSCLLLAITFLVFGAKDYFASLKEPSTLEEELNSAIHELKGTNQEAIVEDKEPEELNNINKKIIIEDYLNSILDRLTKNDYITCEMISSWDTFEILNVNYSRKIIDNYYSYIVDIKISNTNAQLPIQKNQNLSTDKYIVITLTANILKQENSEYIVKSIDIPKES